MFRAARARRITAATAFGGGGLTLVGAGTVGLLYLQARLAHRAVVPTDWTAPRVDGVYGTGDGAALSLVMLGDSTAAGFALTDGLQTPGSLLASGLSAIAERPVALRNVAVVGATSPQLAEQMERLRHTPVGAHGDTAIAVIFVGANDVINRVRPADSARHLGEATRELRAMGYTVVVGTCPDLGTVAQIGWPLRAIARRASRQLAAVQTIAAVAADGRTVSLGTLLADEFQDHPDDMFGPDRFHPSARGYAHAASAVLPSACVALGLLPELETAGGTGPDEAVLPVDRAAVKAAEKPGVEVSGAHVSGDENQPRGRWATLIRRRRGAVPTGEPPKPAVATPHRGRRN